MVNEDILTKLVADKSDLNRNEVEEQLNELIQNVQTKTKKGESVEIDGFGTFKPQNETTTFEPDEVFKTEINQKYAGMKPIELMGSFKDSDAAVAAESINEPVSQQPITPKNREEPIAETEPSHQASEPEAADSPPQPANAAAAQQKTTQESSAASRQGKEQKVSPSNESGPMGTVAVIIAIITALLLAGWLLYSLGVFSSQPNTANAQPTAEQTDYSSSVPAQKQPAAERMTAQAGINKSLAAQPGESATPVYGLKGTIQANAKEGYTIVVHSLIKKQHAFETLNSIKQQGYRALMLVTQVNGQKYWRIGIGQFKTIADAQEATQTLPEPFKSNHFIKHQ